MTTQTIGTSRPASLPGGVTGYAGQPVTWSSSRTSMTRRSQRIREYEFTKSGSRSSFPESRRDLACWSGEL